MNTNSYRMSRVETDYTERAKMAPVFTTGRRGGGKRILYDGRWMTKTLLHQQHAEGLRYFVGEGELNNVLRRLCADLKRYGIDYIVIGAVALMAHGYWRFTEDINLVLTPEGLETFHQSR